MSASYEYSYEIERKRRQEIYNERIRGTTEAFYRRYMKQYDDMVREGFEAYIPEEMRRLKGDLKSIRDNLETYPVEARDRSYEVGSYINGIFSIGRAAIQQYYREERMRREEEVRDMEKNRSELLRYYYDAIQIIKSPVLFNFAKPALEGIKQRIVTNIKVPSSDFESIKQDINRQISKIAKEAEQKALEWKEQRKNENAKQDLLLRLDEYKKDIDFESIENSEEASKLTERINYLRSSIKSGEADTQKFESELRDLAESLDNIVVSENVRREAVKAVVKSLRDQEFSVAAPELVENGNNNFVKVVAQKPSGKRAECRVDLLGKIKYKFDSYEGMACLKDIEKFNIELEDIYSIKLSEERILWENPNKISKEEKTMLDDRRRGM